MPKRVETGTVTSAASSKTRRVEVPRIVRHHKYGRILHRRTVCHVHDERNASALGDLVEIIECRPRSRTKRWELVRVVAKSTAVDVASLRSGARATRLKETAARAEEAEATGGAEAAGRADGARRST
ncbi:MAG: 30S ribosomal protein S17 [Planctomycetes bacterium]|nr:30S ribosomal protein S17 [Planctomycetota bacterium]MBM4059184.1 30S ribosomal protein S17 [Planctomycetota bacterium]